MPSPDELGEEKGFSTIELMVIVLIIAILIAIAVPTFTGARKTANDRATETNLRNAFAASRVLYNTQLRYSSVPSDLVAIEPALAWTTSPLDPSSPDRSVQVQTLDIPDVGQTLELVGRSRSGRCFYLRDVMQGASTGTYYNAKAASGACPPVPDPSDSGWAPQWP